MAAAAPRRRRPAPRCDLPPAAAVSPALYALPQSSLTLPADSLSPCDRDADSGCWSTRAGLSLATLASSSASSFAVSSPCRSAWSCSGPSSPPSLSLLDAPPPPSLHSLSLRWQSLQQQQQPPQQSQWLSQPQAALSSTASTPGSSFSWSRTSSASDGMELSSSSSSSFLTPPSRFLHSAESLPAAPLAPAPALYCMSLSTALAEVDAELLYCMSRNEHSHAPSPYYLSQQPQLDAAMRPVLFDWLMEVAAEFRLQRETVQLAFNYTERYLSAPSACIAVVQRCDYQLLGISCLFLACKVEESKPPRAEELALTTDGACSARQICEMESRVCRALQWRLQAVTPIAWLRVLIQLCVRRLHQQLVDTLAEHLHQSAACKQRLCEAALVDDDPLASLACSCCPLCCALYCQFQTDLSSFLSLPQHHTAAQLCDLAAFELLSLHYYPSSIATSALLIAHSDSPSRLHCLCSVSGYTVELLSPLLIALQTWQSFPVQSRGDGDDGEEELVCLQVHYTGALDWWRKRH